MSANPRHGLRQQLLDARSQFPAAQRMAAAEAMAAHLRDWAPWRNSAGSDASAYVAGYWAVRGEMPLHGVLARADDEFVYCLPCIEPGSRLSFAPWRMGDPVETNRFGIPEPTLDRSSRLQPEDLAVVLVPLLGFDRHGNRLGSGAGYYDRSFAFRQRATKRSPLLVGIGYAAQELPALDAADWDVPLDAVVTEQGMIDCAKEREEQSA
ncbi:MAG: 5-formyltetrahydrofolate cyclo-ligase [Lysobacteraceae bacterium]